MQELFHYLYFITRNINQFDINSIDLGWSRKQSFGFMPSSLSIHMHIHNVFWRRWAPELLECRVKCLAAFRVFLRSEFKFHQVRFCISSIWSPKSKYQLIIGSDMIEKPSPTLILLALCIIIFVVRRETLGCKYPKPNIPDYPSDKCTAAICTLRYKCSKLKL